MSSATYRKAYERVYRMAILGITGALRTTPTIAMGALLGLPPPHITVEEEAWRAALRLRHLGLWKRTGLGHTVILNRQGAPRTALEQSGDRCTSRFQFNRVFRVTYPLRETWANNPDRILSPKGPVWYTDGSKTETGTGAGFWCGGPRTSRSLALEPTATVLQTEMYVLLACARHILSMGYKGKHIYICSDSRTALKHLDACVVRSVLTWDCITVLSRLAKDNRVSLVWVPGHSGIQGNEIAHNLAKEGASRQPSDEGFLPGLRPGLIRCLSKQWTVVRFADLCDRTPGMAHSKGHRKT
ncbi:uncharacterized protein LOC124406230 [Diprion similis]|uniref:uncharacterized protein LOC124406230 n=1 Tax=Diprion similis TaxID=362088 RepID=UPI001EF94EC4|nr:uncharacterized protein LOC124406230 [Diprion similis]